MKYCTLSLFCILFSLTNVNAQSAKLIRLANWMEGSFSSEVQHLQDKENYYHIKLDIIRVWPEREDGVWFYVEQAAKGYETKPYRQRVYHLYENNLGQFESVIYTFDNPLSYAQNYLKFEREVSAEDCTEKEGCTVYLTYEGSVYVGGTKTGTCVSKRSGSAYATAQVEVYRDLLYSWDRGFDENGKYVWGAEKSGYIFLRER